MENKKVFWGRVVKFDGKKGIDETFSSIYECFPNILFLLKDKNKNLFSLFLSFQTCPVRASFVWVKK